ncbi:Coenzyme F420 hydrogenase/dehydrogenase, beta subunit C-terminal domain [uncultured Fibrobacter sp.]|uniref:Coenzyme F420 hydrogenase/dehydrogenase, beta subunit C-terminal domain n=1 Tax=uncultured Fibrobacter sp. TaxID=261512 RepID=UPI002629C771|nr:Coenzyme F420 hydrogenase/dehydrogenase, beta subunit C-terminal domain [uncultured Fibrobacter sp.]
MALSPEEIHLCDQSLCTGCMACRQICKVGAISTKKIGGFLYPDINKGVCKACGLCMNVCPVLNLKGQKGVCHKNTQTCLAAWNKSVDVRMKSSSGGVFSALAEQVLLKGGVVFGAAWDSNMVLKHKAVERLEDLESIRRSKYVQSDVGETFNQVLQYLKTGRAVLYCGVHCQIAGLRSFIGKDFDNLYLVDVLCQGVPSPAMFRSYLDEIEQEFASRVVDCNFRHKDKGWRCGLSLNMTLENGKNVRRILDRNEYYNAFFNEFFLRDSCYKCKFKVDSLGYSSDITLGDFWRIGNKIPLPKEVEKNYTRGISAVVVNTEKGRLLLERCVGKIETLERSWNEFSTNGGLYSSKKNADDAVAKNYLECHGWHATQQKFFPLTRKRKIKNLLMLICGEKMLRKFMKMG